jgi:predicted AAA+ superfamily ATPase
MLYRTVTKHILEDLAFFPIIGIIGSRQVGKTTLAKYVQQTLSLDTLYLDLELDSDRRRLSDAEAFLKLHQDKCVVLDEVQRMPELFPLLRALVDMDRRPARFILLGSASPELIKGSSETLAGRIAYTELTPFSLLEVSMKYSLQDHWLKGGFPQAMLAPHAAQTTRWLHTFIETFIYRDLQALGHTLTPHVTSRLIEMLTALNGNLLNVSDLSRSLGITQPSVNRYLDLLEGGFIISRLQPYFINISKRIVKAPKVYIRDSGILHSVSHITTYDQLLGHPGVGASWEGYVIEQIRRVAGKNWTFYFYRTHKGAETDLLLISPTGKKICIEIKFSTSPTLSRGFYETLKDIQPDSSFVIIPSGEAYPREHGILVCNLEEFLNQYLADLEK